ncbi:type IV pilus assembly protein PilY1 [Amphritea atlantica]|uniref:Type IV pilus assembly protein PilY1 n=1 Tax=Amphritea atlantica TaxID=355243 RepID=A0A1H9LLY8_9GAMM|nr:PilC/PilY family type IV pilus protein [Amphritea atlantica]SER12522.1 type IV pilus assembly protein PilY1 [Amphritea atlantica]
MKDLESASRYWLALVFISIAGTVSSSSLASTVAQTPLFLGQGNVPGNLALVPSVEWPTVLSAANIGSYDEDSESIGYFDPKKCYRYQYDADEAERHFYPVSINTNYKCPGDVWSGNFLNWATTQTIDPFRWALTGGYRVKDTATETWLEKARHSGQNNYFDVRSISGSTVVNNATPFSTSSFETKIGGLGNKMQFTLPSGHGFSNTTGAASFSELLNDTDFSSGWSDYSSGAVIRSSTESFESGGYSLKKINNNDPHGGYKDLSSSANYDNFVFEGWIYRPTVGTQNGQSDRLALSDNSANGYGINISAGTIKIEKRNGGSASNMETASWTRPTDQWYRFVFESVPGDKFKLTVYDNGGTELASVQTTSADTSYNTFNRLYVHGGHEYYVDKLRVASYSGGGTIAYDPISTNTFGTSVRIKVCDPSIGVEANCKQYDSGWKPEGLIQRYADNIRYSIFGYLNDSNYRRDGGVLRARQKFVGPIQLDPSAGEIANSNMEWDPSTGILERNPDPTDASDTASYYGTTVSDSGVINYLNKFGQLNNNNFKSYDPVSELYYTALRYYKHQGNVDEYYTKSPAHNSSPGNTEIAKWVDNFPVIRSWNDPIQYACQKNVVLGIGDVNTHRDKNLPGNTSGTDEPTKPTEVSTDLSVNVRTATDKIAALEGISIDTGASSYSGRNNSAFMAGLAYDANTMDIRPVDFAGTQTVQTYWVDVLENQYLRNLRNNQFWLTAKYGGFVVRKHPSCSLASYTPTGTECDDQSLGDPYLRTDPLPEWWWYTNTDILNPDESGSDYKRTDNFYTAGDARKMVDGLTDAFASISASVKGSAAALTANSSRLDTDTALFNALMDSSLWSGDLVAREVDSNGAPSLVELWSAASILDALTDADMTSRNIFTSTYAAEDVLTGITLNSSGADFIWSDLSAEQKLMLRSTPASGAPTTEAVAQQRLDYLRGSRALEQTLTNSSKPFRRRGSRLGDIVNSSPQYVSNKSNFGYSRLGTSFGTAVKTAYKTYRSSSDYVNKPPILIVGANDGMLHAFDATADSSTANNGGKELFAYVPSGVFGNLYELTDPNYGHRYYVDGEPRVSDAWFAPADVPTGVSSGWKTVVAVTPGAGGAGVSLLDISNPESMTKEDILWEFKHKDMGSLIQQPTITALPNGKFGVVISSGFVHGASQGYIWILNVADGSIIRELVVPTTGGLGEPAVIDLNQDRIADRIIVGDTLGNLWRFDIKGATSGNWAPPTALLSGTTPLPFFVAKDASGVRQPITGAIRTTYDSRGRHMVLFGTGSYYLSGDNEVAASPQVQTLYGVRDIGVAISDRSNLLKQEIVYEGNVGTNGVRVTSNNSLGGTDKGWYLDLEWSTTQGGPGALGELVNTSPVLYGSQVLFATKIPSADPCSFGGSSWIMALDLESGSRFGYSSFDFNGDAAINDSDKVTVPASGGNTAYVAPGSGVMINQGDGGFSNISDSVVTGVGGKPDNLYVTESAGTEPVQMLLNSGFEQGRKGWREIR